MERNIIVEFVKFIGVGGVTTSFGLTLYFIFLEILNWPLFPVYSFVFIVSVLLSYILNSIFTFEKKRKLGDLFTYYFVYFLGFCLGLLILLIINSVEDQLNSFVKVLITLPPRILFVFVLLKIFLYRKSTYQKGNQQ